MLEVALVGTPRPWGERERERERERARETRGGGGAYYAQSGAACPRPQQWELSHSWGRSSGGSYPIAGAARVVGVIP